MVFVYNNTIYKISYIILKVYAKLAELILRYAMYSNTHTRKSQYEKFGVNFEVRDYSDSLKLY